MITEKHLDTREISYQAGLTRQFDTIRECLNVVIHSHIKGLARSASACDMRPSELSEAIRGINGRRIDIDNLDVICQELDDWRPLDWWIEKRKEDAQSRKARLLDRLAMQIEGMQELLADPEIADELASRRRSGTK